MKIKKAFSLKSRVIFPVRSEVKLDTDFQFVRLTNIHVTKSGDIPQLYTFNIISRLSVSITTKGCEFEPRSCLGVLDTTMCDKVCP